MAGEAVGLPFHRQELMMSQGELAEALAAAQAELRDPVRSRTGQVRGKRDYKYVGLDDLLQTVRPVLSRHGLAVTQTFDLVDGRTVLRTTLMHAAGGSITGCYPLSWPENPQEQGSAATYARRYSLEALVGVAATEDDDAATATESSAARQPEPPARPAEPETNRSSRAAPTSTTDKREHHPSWPGHQAWFCAQLRDIDGCTYATLANWCTANGKRRPSEVDTDTRHEMLKWAQSNQGREALGLRPIVGGGQ